MMFTGAGAPAVLRELADACHAKADVLGEAICFRCLGDIALARSDHAEARIAYEQARPLFRQIGNVLGEANCIEEPRRHRAEALGSRRGADRLRAGAARSTARSATSSARPTAFRGLGDIALARSDHAEARIAYEQALPLYRQIGNVLGEANCIRGLGDIALAERDRPAARRAYVQALALYVQIAEPYSIGWTHVRLARIATGAARAQHVAAARDAWGTIDRPDLLDWLAKEFP